MPHPIDTDAQLVNAAALRALAHPLRIQLLDQLDIRGCATASVLARDIGESSGATSYHLRQLAKYGMVVEDTGRGTARERWWRRRPGGLIIKGHDFLASPNTRAAARVVIDELHRGRWQRLQHWVDTAVTEWPRHWIESSIDSDNTLWLRPEQLRSLVGEFFDVLQRYRALSDGENSAASADEDLAAVEVQFNAFPKRGTRS